MDIGQKRSAIDANGTLVLLSRVVIDLRDDKRGQGSGGHDQGLCIFQDKRENLFDFETKVLRFSKETSTETQRFGRSRSSKSCMEVDRTSSFWSKMFTSETKGSKFR